MYVILMNIIFFSSPVRMNAWNKQRKERKNKKQRSFGKRHEIKRSLWPTEKRRQHISSEYGIFSIP